MTPITLPSLPTIGTETSDWNRSSSSSGTYLMRGSSSAFVADERRLLALGRPPGEPLAALERDLADQLRVRLGGGREHEPLAAVLDEVDEAGVDGARVREQPDDRPEHLLELERRADRRDDLVENPALPGMGARRAYGRMVRRMALGVTRQAAPRQLRRRARRSARSRRTPA